MLMKVNQNVSISSVSVSVLQGRQRDDRLVTVNFKELAHVFVGARKSEIYTFVG